jgi:hypothetical protein
MLELVRNIWLNWGLSNPVLSSVCAMIFGLILWWLIGLVIWLGAPKEKQDVLSDRNSHFRKEATASPREAQFQRVGPRIRIKTPLANFGGDFLPTGRIELHIINGSQEETTLSSLKILVRDWPYYSPDSGGSSHGYPILDPVDLVNGNPMPFPIRIAGAADVRLSATVAGGSAEVIKGSRVEWEGELTRGEILDPVIRDFPPR